MLSEPLLEKPNPAIFAYSMLLVAIVFEVAGTVCMRFVKDSEVWRIPSYVCYAVAFSLFPWIINGIPLAMAYATWSGVGSVCIGAISTYFFEENMSLPKICGILFIILGIFLIHL